jgi:predicted MPP superfamily phosphohydrolase
MALKYPILIAGGGPVGVITALALARQGLEVRVYEAMDAVNEAPRASTTHPATLEMLAGLDLLDEVVKRGLVARTFQFWDRPTGRMVAEFDHEILKDDTAYPFVVQCEQHKIAKMAIARLSANMGLARVRQVIDLANAQNADLIVLLGDFVATHRFVTEVVPHAAWSAELARLRAPLGVYTILGNHDWWHGLPGVRGALAAAGIPVLENDAVKLGRAGEKFWLAGIGDQLAYPLGRGRFRGVDDLPGTLARLTDDDPAILLVHEPDIFVQVPDRFALTLAGHTHGGQVRLPFLWPYWVPSRYGTRFAYGHVVERDRHMIVSGGLGTSSVPMRLGVPPEVLRIDLGA